MTEPASSARHVPKLVEDLPEYGPVFACQLCGRRGTLDQLRCEECPKRSGAISRSDLEAAIRAAREEPKRS